MMPPSMNLNNTPESAKKRGGAVMMPPSMNLNNTPESAKKRGGAVMMPPNMNLNNIPERAKKECAFVIWKYQPRGNGVKPAKVPYNPKTSAPADTADPSTFGGFSEVQNYAKARYDGVGVGIFRLSDGSCLAAIDIDHCIDENENLSPMADDIMKTMRAYTEVSPSGRGIRILFLLTPGFVFDSNKYYINNQAKGLEVYVAGATNKYVSVTGNTQTPGADLELRDAELLRVLEKYMVRPGQLVSQPAPQQAQPVAQDSGQPDNPLRPEDLALIESIKNGPSGEKFMALGQGDISICGNDHSSADMAFCNILAARTQDAGQIDRIIRNSRLMREKWDRPSGRSTYGSLTVQKAISSALAYRQQSLAPAQQAIPQQPLAPAQQAIPQQPLAAPVQQAAPARKYYF